VNQRGSLKASTTGTIGCNVTAPEMGLMFKEQQFSRLDNTEDEYIRGKYGIESKFVTPETKRCGDKGR
jgi:hypothetical protein